MTIHILWLTDLIRDGNLPVFSPVCAPSDLPFHHQVFTKEALLTLPWVFWRAVDEGTPLSA